MFYCRTSFAVGVALRLSERKQAARDNEVLLVDERTGKEMKRITLGSPVRMASIARGKEKMLLLLTADQVIHRVPLAN